MPVTYFEAAISNSHEAITYSRKMAGTNETGDNHHSAVVFDESGDIVLRMLIGTHR
jgi:hypothetical protein